MPVWKHNATWEPCNVAGLYRGLDCYICCPGPSLKNIDPATLKGRGRFVIGVNTSYPFVRPDVWVGMDKPHCYDGSLWGEPFTKIVRGDMRDEKVPGLDTLLRDCPNTLFADVSERVSFPAIFHPNNLTNASSLCWEKNTFAAALHLALLLGSKRIFLVGCDFGGDYFDGRKLGESARVRNQVLYSQIEEWLPIIHAIAGMKGIQIYSCSKSKYLKSASVEECLMMSSTLAVTGKSPVVHCERFKWQPLHMARERVVCFGYDKSNADLVSWFLGNIHRSNPGLPCVGFNFEEEFTDVSVSCNWSKKPLAILNTDAKQILWLDVDCEVRGSLDPWFKVPQGSIGVCPDPVSPRKEPYNAGVVSCWYGDRRVEVWAERTVVNDSPDQPVLCEVLNSFPGEKHVFPQYYNWLRLMPLGSDDYHRAIVRHWTGKPGKNHIRNVLMKGKVLA